MNNEYPLLEQSYYYPKDLLNDLNKYELISNQNDDKIYLNPIKEKVCVLSHDDYFDPNIYEIEQSQNISSTWFILNNDYRNVEWSKNNIDFQIHLNKEYDMVHQIESFDRIHNHYPITNRYHRLLWRSDNFDFLYLTRNSIKVDSSKIGVKPYYPIIEGRKIPILELPICISDQPKDMKALWNVFDMPYIPFRKGITPIVVLAHPFQVCIEHNLSSCFKTVLLDAKQYEYKIISISQFMEEYVK